MKEEKYFFENADGLMLCGILSLPSKKTSKCIILCHGIAVDKNEDGVFVSLTNALVEKGFAVFRFDFRAHGESEGNSIDLAVTGEAEDLTAAFHFMQKKRFGEIGILGASFAGGAVSLFSFQHVKKIKTLVFWNSLLDYSTRVYPVTPWGKKYWGKPAMERIEKQGYAKIGESGFTVGKALMEDIEKLKPWENLTHLSLPMLFVHGDKDTYTSYEDSVKFSKMVQSGKLVTISGSEHGFHEEPFRGQAIKATVDFFTKNM